MEITVTEANATKQNPPELYETYQQYIKRHYGTSTKGNWFSPSEHNHIRINYYNKDR